MKHEKMSSGKEVARWTGPRCYRLGYQPKEPELSSVDKGELLKVFRRLVNNTVELQKINLAAVRKIDWSGEKPEDRGKVGDSQQSRQKGNVGPK